MTPTPVDNPVVVSVSKSCLELLDLSEDDVLKRPEWTKWLAGNELPPGSESIAHCYCGYQFGYFSG